MRILGLFFIFIIFVGEGISKEWNGIVPCVSSRSKVEKLLGKDEIPHKDPIGTYRFGKSRIYVDYFANDSKSPMDEIVNSIVIYPGRAIPLRSYVKQVPSFHTVFAKTTLDSNITHIPYLAHYNNVAEGFEIVTQKNDQNIEVITSFRYYGLESDCSKLHSC